MSEKQKWVAYEHRGEPGSSPVFGDGYLPDDFHFSHALDAFHSIFVNSYADHHTHEFIPKTG